MNKLRYLKITVFLIIFALCNNPVLSQENSQDILLPVGRDNPFAQIPKSVRPVPQARTNPSEIVEEKPELFMQTIMLKFLDARSLMIALENMLSRYGTIATGEENNSLIICDTKENLEKIVAEIQKADKTPQQIMVEVVIIDVQLSDDTEIGINWDILSNKNYDIGYRQNFTNRLGSTIDSTANIGNASAFNTIGTGGDFSVISGTIRHVVSMLQQKRTVEILASPRVMVVSGKTASIEAVKELPYNEITNTSEGGQLSSTEFKKVGVKLNVTATLTEGNFILLTVDSEQNVTVGESITQVPIIDTRNTKSELLLENGQVVIIGGLRRKEMTKQIDQIPILGDIPLIGLLFKYTKTVVENTELIVFLSPHIYNKDEPIPDEAMKKYREIIDRPILSLNDESDTKNNNDILRDTYTKHTDKIKQIRQKINECEQAQTELQKYRELNESKLKEQTVPDELTIKNISECKEVEAQLVKYRDQLKQYLQNHSSATEHIRLEINKRKENERDFNKKILLDRIKYLQQNNNEESAGELISALTSLDKIISEEIQETLDISNEFISKGNIAESQSTSGEIAF